MLRKVLLPTTVILGLGLILSSFIYLTRTGRVTNPLRDVKPNNIFLSNVVNGINSFLSSPADQVPTGSESLEESFAARNYPAELYSFDVTQQQAVFAVEGVDAQNHSLLLRFLFPFVQSETTIKAKIGCPLEDSWLLEVNPNIEEMPKRTLAAQPLDTLAAKGDTLQGICSDDFCRLIVKSCELLRIKE